jgi:hypothetical protein
MMAKGSYTVEAAFVMSICVWILMAIILCGLYVHDRVVLSTFTNEQTALWVADSGGVSATEWTGQLKSRLEDQMFFISVRSVKSTRMLNCRRVRVSYTLPDTWGLIRNILLGGKKEKVYETKRETVVPADYMWDASVVKE